MRPACAGCFGQRWSGKHDRSAQHCDRRLNQVQRRPGSDLSTTGIHHHGARFLDNHCHEHGGRPGPDQLPRSIRRQSISAVLPNSFALNALGPGPQSSRAKTFNSSIPSSPPLFDLQFQWQSRGSTLSMRGLRTVLTHRGLSPHQFTPMSGAHHSFAANPAITALNHARRLWRRFAEKKRWANSPEQIGALIV